MNFTFQRNHILKSIAFTGIMAGFGWINGSSSLKAQDGQPIVIIDRYGERVESGLPGTQSSSSARASSSAGSSASAGSSGGSSARSRRQSQSSSKRSQTQSGGQTAQAKSGISVQNKDGRVTIIDSEGNKRELNLEGAQGIIINQGEKTVIENGQKKLQVFGKAIIVGPDGKRQEIEISDPMAMGIFDLGGIKGNVLATYIDNKFVIGVNCDPVSDVLASQLSLETGTGLVVLSISKGSAAAKAGIQKHDILMFADDRQLSQVSDLTEVIQTAGKEKSKISFTIIRGGKEVGINVSPVERSANQPKINGNFNLQMRQALPGIIFDPEFAPNNKDLDTQMKEQMDEMLKRMDQMHRRMEQQFNKDGK